MSSHPFFCMFLMGYFSLMDVQNESEGVKHGVLGNMRRAFINEQPTLQQAGEAVLGRTSTQTGRCRQRKRGPGFGAMRRDADICMQSALTHLGVMQFSGVILFWGPCRSARSQGSHSTIRPSHQRTSLENVPVNVKHPPPSD